MKKTIAAILVAILTVGTLPAATNYFNGFGGQVFHTHSGTSDFVISFDWGADNTAYYQTRNVNFNFSGLHTWNGLLEANPVAASSDFAGASVVRVGDYIYYNTSDFTSQKIWKYGALSGTPSNGVLSTATNFSLHTDGAALFVTGSVGFGTNRIYRSGVNSSGDLTNVPLPDLGETFGNSGPLAFDLAGNLYYAPGFGDLSIYKWTAAEVVAAIGDPINNPLPQVAGARWYDYSSVYATVAGGTGLSLDANGDLFLSLTSFTSDSFLVKLDVGLSGQFAGISTVLSTDGRLGDVKFFGGNVYFAQGNMILQVVPEPTGVSLLLAGVVMLLGRRRAARTV